MKEGKIILKNYQELIFYLVKN